MSKLTRDLQSAVRAFHEGRLSDDYAYLFLDGVSLRVRRAAGRKRVQMLVAYGVRRDGTRHLLRAHRQAPFKAIFTPPRFGELLARIPEPYATMVYVAIYTGLRVSELAGLRWNDLGDDTITIYERFCRGDWGSPKSESSNATIPVYRSVIERIHLMKLLTVEVKAGRAVRKYRIVKSDKPNDLVFQSVRDGQPIRDNNILTRFIKPAGKAMDLPWVNWRCLRTSHAVWLKLAGADVKDAQGQMRHSRASTTMDIADFETSQFAASHAGGVERHQQRPSKQGSRRIHQSRNFLPG